MGQVSSGVQHGDVVLSDVDRLVALNAGGGLPASASHVILLGQNAGANMGVNDSAIIALGENAGLTLGAGISDLIFLGRGAGTSATANDLIVVGHNSGTGSLGFSKLVLIGNDSVNGVGITSPAGRGMIAVGHNLMPLARVGMGDSIYIGNDTLPTFVKTGAAAANKNLVIGNNTLVGTASGVNAALSGNLIIGHDAAPMNGLGATPYQSVLMIGNSANANGVAQLTTDSVIIGHGSGFGGGVPSIATAATVCGNANTINMAAVAHTGAAIFGRDNQTTNNNNILIVGNSSRILTGNTDSIFIGVSLNVTRLTPAATGTFVLGNDNIGALFYGRMVTGNLCVGNSLAADRTFRSTPGTNNLKLLNGTSGTGAEVNQGGYFFVTGGVLTWRDQNGIETTLSNTASGQMLASVNIPFTNNAGAALGTLTNSPLAGNPTKWIPINDNGTTRNIPVW